MGFLKDVKSAWKSMSTATKVNWILDIICGFGAGAASGAVTRKLAPGMNKIERVCVSVTMCGLGMAAGDVAAKAYKPYVDSICGVIDNAKKDGKEEDEANG